MKAATPPILIADDDERVFEQLVSFLRPLGYHVEGARDGREVLGKLAAEPFDLLILDVMMPYLDGVEVLRTVRQNPHLCRIPILMLTAMSALVTENEARCAWLRDLGADECLVKPRLSSSEIVAMVHRLLTQEAG